MHLVGFIVRNLTRYTVHMKVEIKQGFSILIRTYQVVS